jgi:hypothetical protein
MSYKQGNEPKQEVYPIINMRDNGRLILPDHIITQINYLHGKCGNVEWSAILLYDVIKGSPKKPKDFVLEAKHIFLMDIGSSAHTEYETDGDIVDLYDNIEGAMEAKIGHVHTHHNMGTYFSATDMSELNDNVDKHNYYLSLIVNMGGTYTAKVAFLSQVHSTLKMSFNEDSGKESHFKTDNVEKTMIVVDMDVYYKYTEKFFYDRYTEVKKKIAAVEKAKAKNYTRSYNRGLGDMKWDAKTQNWVDIVPELPVGKNLNTDDIDPKNMTNVQVETLARNVFSVSPKLDEMRGVYQVLHTLSNSSEDRLEYYYQWLAENLELIIENYFDQSLEINEMTEVINEIGNSMIRFANIPLLSDVIEGITTVLMEFMVNYEKVKTDEEIEEQKEEDQAKLLEIEAGEIT